MAAAKESTKGQTEKQEAPEAKALREITQTVEEMGRDFGGIPAPITERIIRLRKLCGLVV